MMNIVYRIERGVLSLVSNAINKLVMILSGISYGKGFRSCGIILYRKYFIESLIVRSIYIK